MKQPYIVAKEGFPYILILLLITIALGYFNIFIAIVPLILLLFVTYFFRNPKRVIPQEEDILVSPADGVVMEITEVYEDRFLESKAIKVSIFLSIFNVHLNRAPLEGIVKYRAYRPGKFIPAFKSHASDINEKSYLGIENSKIKILVNQVTGFIARRIVTWSKVNDHLNKGELFGLIKFGSCTELIVPLNVDILVNKGDKVTGGETIIGRIKNEH